MRVCSPGCRRAARSPTETAATPIAASASRLVSAHPGLVAVATTHVPTARDRAPVRAAPPEHADGHAEQRQHDHEPPPRALEEALHRAAATRTGARSTRSS